MDDLIKREDALEAILDYSTDTVMKAWFNVKNVPSKERIVRCRECRKKYSCVTFEGIANEDGFCSLGEAETEGE